jgi:chromosome segregation ATPase
MVAAVSTGFAASRQTKSQTAQAPTPTPPSVVELINRLEAKLDKVERKLDAVDPEHRRLAQMIEETQAMIKRFAEISLDVYEKMERKADAAEAKLDRLGRGLEITVGRLERIAAVLERLEAKLDKLEAKADRHLGTTGG